MAKDTTPPDWEGIEEEYRAGAKSVRMVAAAYGISDTAIRKRAKAEGWTRNLVKEVRRRSAEKATVRGSQSDGSQDGSQSHVRTDEEIIEAAADKQAEIRLIHRKDIRTHLSIVDLLSKQLIDGATSRDELSEEIEEETKGDKSPQRRNRMLKAISLPQHATIARDLSTAMKNLVGLERQAHGIDDEATRPSSGPSHEEWLDQLDD